MTKHSVDKFNPNRAYFTEFDRATYSQVAWTEEDVAGIIHAQERKIKLLTLTKGHVVIATSQPSRDKPSRDTLLIRKKDGGLPLKLEYSGMSCMKWPT
jgi:hypothetical protein